MKVIETEEILDGRVPKCLIPPLSDWFAFDWTNDFFKKITDQSSETGRTIFDCGVEELDIIHLVNEEGFENIPKTGPLVVVANHPSPSDGIVLGHVVSSARNDMKIMANYLWERVPNLKKDLISVDPFGGEESKQKNLAGMRAAISHLRDGGTMLVFPSGEVAHYTLKDRRVRESPWSPHIVKLIQKTRATVVPVYISADSSKLFNAGGLIHPMLRTAQLPRELRRSRGKTIRIKVGRPILPKRMVKLEAEAGADFLHRQVQLLGAILNEEQSVVTREGVKLDPVDLEPIIEPGDQDVITAEVEALPADCLMIEKGDWTTYIATAEQIPSTLREIGRLREKTFRSVGEGTGKSHDLDEFDQWYLHAFLWNNKTKTIAGAYRLGPTELILPERGVEGLYCHSLFQIDEKLFQRIGGPAIELGRSFVVEEHQRGYISLSTLWLGIGQYFKRNPQYRYTFGPVSISQDYQSVSRSLIVQFLRKTAYSEEYSKFVRPRTDTLHRETTTKTKETLANLVKEYKTVEEIDTAVSGIEDDGKGLPVLLRQYLRFNAILLSFNVDSDFSGALDGLAIGDLTSVTDRVGERIMGEGVVDAIRDYYNM